MVTQRAKISTPAKRANSRPQRSNGVAKSNAPAKKQAEEPDLMELDEYLRLHPEEAKKTYEAIDRLERGYGIVGEIVEVDGKMQLRKIRERVPHTPYPQPHKSKFIPDDCEADFGE